MSEIKNGALDQYGAEPFKQQQFGPAGVEGGKAAAVVVLVVVALDKRAEISSSRKLVRCSCQDNRRYLQRKAESC